MAPRPTSAAWRRPLLAVVIVAIVAMWVYVLAPWRDRGSPDRLDSDVFPEQAEEVCQVARDELEQLPEVTQRSPIEELVGVVESANEVIAGMVSELATIVPEATSDDGTVVRRWLLDWDIYLRDRREWTERVRAEGYEPFTESVADGGPITERMDTFAKLNKMPACETP